jgi:hypothetical protein
MIVCQGSWDLPSTTVLGAKVDGRTDAPPFAIATRHKKKLAIA